MRRFISTIILIVAVAAFCWSGFSLAKYAYQSWVTQKNINSLADQINEIPTETVVEKDSVAIVEEEQETVEKETASSEEIEQKESENMRAKYSTLYNRNKDMIGWLSIEGTNINNPVMFTPNDPQYYLRRNFDGDYDIGGMLFADFRSSFQNPVSTNIIIYGHHMNNGTMFGPLMNFQDVDYLKEHRTVKFDTIYRPGTYEIFAAFQSVVYDDSDTISFKYYDFINANTQEEFDDYINHIKAMALYYDDENQPVFGDQIITLSTCDYYTTDGRFVVLAKRVN